MSTIRPFKALRPKKEFASRIASRPYDVVSTEEAKIEAEGNQYSFMHIGRAEIDLPKETDHYSQIVYDKAKESLHKMIKEGVLFEESKPLLYIYAQTMKGRTQYGLVGCASVDEYDNNIIKKHELTRKDKEDDRTRHIMTTNANSEPVFFTYRDHLGVNTLVSEWVKKHQSEYSFTSEDGIKHEVWVIDNLHSVDAVVNYFKEIPVLYIADGHHRSASAARVGREKKKANLHHTGSEEYNSFLAVYFPSSHLMIMDYNRLVKYLNGHSKEDFIEALSVKFEITEKGDKKPRAMNTICMYMKGGHWFTLKAKKGSFDAQDPINSLDVAILQNNVLEPILGIKDPRTDKRIDFVGGIRGTEELEKRVENNEFAVAFSMYPPTLEQLMSVADAGKIMPPKSTWFEPKLRSGLLVHLLD